VPFAIAGNWADSNTRIFLAETMTPSRFAAFDWSLVAFFFAGIAAGVLQTGTR